MPFFIRHLTTSAPVFFMRLASSPTEISSGIMTFTGAFLAISSWSLRIRSASSCLRLLEKVMPPRRWLLVRIFSLPLRCCRCIRAPRSPPRSSSRSSYLARFTSPPLRVSTIFRWGTRDTGCCAAGLAAFCCWGLLPAALSVLRALGGRGCLACWPWAGRGGLAGGLCLFGGRFLRRLLLVGVGEDHLDAGDRIVLRQVFKDQRELLICQRLHVVFGSLGVFRQDLRDGLGGKAEILRHLMDSVFLNTQ